MKIRNGFVTNSSSTNYLILSKKELSPEKLAKLLGVNEDSSFYSVVLRLCSKLLTQRHLKTGYYGCVQTLEEQVLEVFGEKTSKKFKSLTKKGYVAYHGTVSTEEDAIELLFTIDSFSFDKDGVFVDFLEGGY